MNIFDNKDINAVETILNGSDDYCKSLIDTSRARLYLELTKSKDESDYEQVIKNGEESLMEFPNDGEILGLIARAYYRLGEKDKAYDIYSQAVQLTRNSFIWRNAKEDCGIDRMLEEGQC